MDPHAVNTPHPRKGLYGIRYGWWVIICLIYVISPFDLAPEFFLGPIGVIDDAGVVAFGIYNLSRWIAGRRQQRMAGRSGVIRER